MEKYEITLEGLYEAFYDTNRTKGDLVPFSLNIESEIVSLYEDISRGVYKPSAYKCFMVKKPKKREVFASHPRDRIVNHWIGLRIVPLLEDYFSPYSYSCRKGKGTLAYIRDLKESVRRISHDFTTDCYILKLDHKNFFMSIDRNFICDKFCAFLDERYNGSDKATLLYLVRQVILTAPEDNCIIKGDIRDWEDYDESKSLRTNGKDYGLPIGVLLSQLLGNFLLTEVDKFITEELEIDMQRYVDDMSLESEDKTKLLMAIPLIQEKLWETARVRLNVRKTSIQHYTKGSKSVGWVLKYNRIYVSSRVVSNAMKLTYAYNKFLEEKESIALAQIKTFMSSLNSYLGHSKYALAYNQRKKIWESISDKWKEHICILGGYEKIKVLTKNSNCYDKRRNRTSN